MGLFERKSHTFGFDEGNPDIHGEILRPCQVYDTFCIRKFFAEHSECRISGRAVPDPLYRAQGSIHFASNNMSNTQITADYGGLNNARISEFYINNVTDNLVIAVTFDSASKYSNNTYFKYYLRGREPVVTRDFGGIQYGVLTVTVIIPHIHNLILDRSEIYTYGDTNVFPFALGPQIGTSTDPEVTSMYARFFTNIPSEYQEEISNQGIYFVGNYIQYNICDFGVKVL
ncbi:uncharacterized protein LOC133525052 [Cydia pomonella]|uniref:uncharacterized protein LOC133525052 n=1 Tax=Cydia pomonella TaxID=82600 RepID=UPI002ADDC7D2|nr:uncharacterized protein LOC133525052 [Cydia pomonella]